MTSCIMSDAKKQEINVTFAFDQSHENKLIIDALFDRTYYLTEIVSHLDQDFQNIKNSLMSKQYKVVSKTPGILRLKIGMIYYDFENVQKITLNALRQDKQNIAELKQKITELSDKLKNQSQKNVFLEDLIIQLRKEFDLMTTKISDLRQTNDESKQQIIRLQGQWKEKVEEETLKRIQLVDKNDSLRDRIQKLEKERLKQIDEDKIWRTEQQMLSKLHEQKMIKQEEELLKKIDHRVTIKWQELENSYHKKLKILQDGGQEAKVKRQQWENFKKQQEEDLRILVQEMFKKLDDGRDKEQQKEKVKQLEERVRQLQSEIIINMKKQIIQLIHQEKVKEKVEENARKLEEEKIKKQMQEKNRKIQLEQEHQFKINQGQQFKFEKENQKQTQFQQQVSSQNPHYRFSSTHKLHTITLQNNNTKAINSSGWYGLALVEGVVFEKGSSIRFRVQSIGTYVAVGFGIRNVIAKNNYHTPNRSKIGHGCFLLWDGGNSLSHSNKEQNDVETDFKYGEGEVIRVERNGDQLCWMNESKKKEFKMKVKLKADEWAEACFCVFLGKSSVQIME